MAPPPALPICMFSAGRFPAGTPVPAFSSTTTPVGVGEPDDFVTVPLRVTFEPAVPVTLAGASVTLVLTRPGADHRLTRLATLGEPSPLARSYPVPAA